MLDNIKLPTCMILFLFFILSNIAMADSIPKVARLNFMSGTVSLLPGEENQWINAAKNRPLVLGDTLWTDNDSKAELELDSGALRLNSSTSLKILNLTDTISQFQVSEGSIVVTVKHLKPNQTYEIDTPNLAFVINKAGYYRINVANSETILDLKVGSGEVYGENSDAPLEIKAESACTFTGVDLQNHQCIAKVVMDDFDAWVLQREQQSLAATQTQKYVSKTVIGHQDLKAYGSWKSIPQHGNVWVPEYADSDWAPYQDGHWIWLNQWGWTWVDNQPWGFAPFHYGRWIFINNYWAWVPGPPEIEAYYAPALVVFLDIGDNIAWFPLAPGEVYYPAFEVSQTYFNQINISNTYISNINYFYNNPRIQINYQNIHFNNAWSALSKSAFVESKPANISPVKIPRDIINKAKILPYAPISPTLQSIRGGRPAAIAPKMQDLNLKPAVIRTPPPKPLPFSKVQEQLIKIPGKPLDIIRPQSNRTMDIIKPKDDIRPIQPSIEPLRPSHPVPIQKPTLDRPERLRPPDDMRQIKPPTIQPMPAPIERPERDMRGIQPRPAPIQRPPRDMRGIQPRPAPIQRPPREMQDIQPRPAPIQRPPREMQSIQPRPAPIQRPPREMQSIQPRPAPIQRPPREMQDIQTRPAPVGRPMQELQQHRQEIIQQRMQGIKQPQQEIKLPPAQLQGLQPAP